MIGILDVPRYSYGCTLEVLHVLLRLVILRIPGFRIVGLLKAPGFRMVGLLEALQYLYGWTFIETPVFV